MKNEAGFAGHLLSIKECSILFGEDLLRDGLRRSPHYSGPAESFDEDEAAALLCELARYFMQPAPTQYADLYFIGTDKGPIKIGVASAPEKRLKQLQVASPHRLYILATIPGGALQEPVYHERFVKHRLEGEWFARAPEIVAEIQRLASPRQRTDPDHAAVGGLHG